MRLEAIADLVGGRVEGDAEVDIDRVAPLEHAGAGSITFVADPKRVGDLASCGASAAFVREGTDGGAVATIVVADPYLAFVETLEALHPAPRPEPGRHPTAIVAATATVPDDAHVGAYVVIGERVRLGEGAVLRTGACLYDDVVAGRNLTLHARVVLREGVRVGDRVTIHAGAVIGSDGFGYLPTPDGPRKIPQIGSVVLEDDVEIGANATIDRAALGETVIRRGVKIDNLVMVAHGCEVGPGSLLAAQVGLAGGTRLGTGVMLGGQVGSAGHLHVGDGAMVAAKSGIHNDLEAGGTYGGIPAQTIGIWRRASNGIKRFSEIFKRLRRLERAVGIDDRRQDD